MTYVAFINDIGVEPLSQTNASSFHALCLDPHIRRYLLDGGLVSMSWAKEELARSRRAPDALGLWLLSQGQEPIGFVGFRVFEELGPTPQLLYALKASHTGRGLATQAARWAMERAREQGWSRVYATVDSPNEASARVLERLGFSPAGELPGDHGSLRVYAKPLTDQDAEALERWSRRGQLTLQVHQRWDGQPLAQDEQAQVHLIPQPEGLRVEIDAPYYGDEPPPTPPGPTPHLWEHEVVEVFLLGQQERYLELELGPAGHYLALILEGRRHVLAQGMAMRVQVSRQGARWRASAQVPLMWLPPGLSHVNACAIHGRGQERRHEVCFAAPSQAPDFHSLESFGLWS